MHLPNFDLMIERYMIDWLIRKAANVCSALKSAPSSQNVSGNGLSAEEEERLTSAALEEVRKIAAQDRCQLEMEQRETLTAGREVTQVSIMKGPSEQDRENELERRLQDVRERVRMEKERLEHGASRRNLELQMEAEASPRLATGRLRENIEAVEWKKVSTDCRLPVRLGHAEDGSPVVVDLASIGNLFLLGATGAGKSDVLQVALYYLAGSLSPDSLRLVLVDPKRLEFSRYADLPHVNRPVLETGESVARYFIEMRRVIELRSVQYADYDECQRTIVVIDAMTFIWDDVQTVIDDFHYCLEAGPSVGYHFLIASQNKEFLRGWNVFLGEIFRLHVSGGELGKKKLCVHTESPSCRDVSDLLAFYGCTNLKNGNERTFEVETECHSEDRKESSLEDILLQRALRVLYITQRASVSHLQRKLGIGYRHAARLSELLMDVGVIENVQRTGPYKILWTEEQMLSRLEKFEEENSR